MQVAIEGEDMQRQEWCIFMEKMFQDFAKVIDREMKGNIDSVARFLSAYHFKNSLVAENVRPMDFAIKESSLHRV